MKALERSSRNGDRALSRLATFRRYKLGEGEASRILSIISSHEVTRAGAR